MIVFQKRKHERQQIHCAAYLFIDNIFIAQWPWDKIMTFQHDCEANIGNFLAKTQTNISKLQLKLCKTIEIRKKVQDLKAETIWVG